MENKGLMIFLLDQDIFTCYHATEKDALSYVILEHDVYTSM